MVQLSHPYMTTGKTIALRIFVSKVMSLIFNTLSRLRLLNWVISNMTLLFLYMENPCRESHRVIIASCHTSQMPYTRQHGYINYLCFLYNAILPCAKSLQSSPTPCDPMDSSLQDSSPWILERISMPSSRGSSWPREGTCISYVSCTGRQVLYH